MSERKTVQQIWAEATRRSFEIDAKMTPEEREAANRRRAQQMLSLRGWDKKPRIEERPDY